MNDYKDFYYNSHNASDFHLTVIRPEGDTGTFGLSREIEKTELTSERSISSFQSVRYTDTLSLQFLLIKNPCLYDSQTGMEISTDELEQINTWLMSPKTARKLQINPSSSWIEFYGLFTEVVPFEAGRLYGVQATFVCNAPYGFRVNEEEFDCTGSTVKHILNATNELEEYIYPVVSVFPSSTGAFSIVNASDNDNSLNFTLKDEYDEITIDCWSKSITADGKTLTLSDIGWNLSDVIDQNGVSTGIAKICWLKLLSGENILNVSGNGSYKITFRTPVMIGGY